MNVPTIFKTCKPREDVLSGAITEADFAADLAQVIKGKASAEYSDPVRFFANTHPTRGLRNLLASVCGRITGGGGEGQFAAIFRLDTSYGGGKTHGLIALTHAARGMEGVQNVDEFVDPALLPQSPVRIAIYDGENADPINGRDMGDGVLAYTPWGEIACALAGKDGYGRVRKSDKNRIAPGADTLRELFGGEPTLILLDELSVYLRKVQSIKDARNQLTAFLTSLFKAVESTPNAALVYTLAIGKGGRAIDAYSEENQFIDDSMGEMESVSARKATLLNPTEEDETVQVLRRRLFESIDEKKVPGVVDAYKKLWVAGKDSLTEDAARSDTVEFFRSSYPFHPEILKTLTGKTATLATFQRVRGMLRLLAGAIAHLWKTRPADANAIHLHHIDPGHKPIHQEIVTRLGQSAYEPAITNDVAGSVSKKALAETIDAEHHQGLPPYAVYVARTIFMHTLAFNKALKGISPEQLRWSVVGPATDISFIEAARKKFIAESAYLDDNAGAPMRFAVEANLNQMIRSEERHVDAGEVRKQLNDRIREIFKGRTLETVPFPGGPYDVPDEVGAGLPMLVVISYDAVSIGGEESVPDLVKRIFERKGSEGSAVRKLRNNLVFVVADEARKEEMQRKTRERLALQELKKPERLVELAEHQQDRVRQLEAQSEHALAIAIQQCYRHLFYPSRNRVGKSDVDLGHSAIDMQSTSDQPGAGQQQIVRALRDHTKLRLPEDEPDSPTYVRDRTPLKTKGHITTLALRNEFRLNPALPMLIGNEVFTRGVKNGIEKGDYVYQNGDLLCGQGDPPASITIEEDSMVLTMAYATNKKIWPRKQPEPDGDKAGESSDESTKGESDTGGGGETTGGDIAEDPAPTSFGAEGVLREALIQLWEKARAAKAESIDVLTIRMFEATDAFRLLGAVGAISGADKIVTMEGSYETREGGSFEFEFRGPVPDARLVKEFLESQLRDVSEKDITTGFELTFAEGLSMQDDGAKKLTERLAKFAASASADVSATPKEKT